MVKNLKIKEKIIQKEPQAEMVQEVVVLILILLLELQKVYWEDQEEISLKMMTKYYRVLISKQMIMLLIINLIQTNLNLKIHHKPKKLKKILLNLLLIQDLHQTILKQMIQLNKMIILKNKSTNVILRPIKMMIPTKRKGKKKLS